LPLLRCCVEADVEAVAFVFVGCFSDCWPFIPGTLCCYYVHCLGTFCLFIRSCALLFVVLQALSAMFVVHSCSCFLLLDCLVIFYLFVTYILLVMRSVVLLDFTVTFWFVRCSPFRLRVAVLISWIRIVLFIRYVA